MKKRVGILAATFVLALLLSSCAGNDADKTNAGNEELTPTSSMVMDEEEAAVLNEKVPICLYFSDEQQTKLVREIRYVDINEAKKGAATLASAIVKELTTGPKASGLKTVLPEGTSLRGPVKIDGRVAVVDLTKEFIDNHPGGKTLEELTVYSIVNSLTELKEIERVKIVINGKETKTFKGNLTLNADFPRNDAVVNKELGMARPEDGGLLPVTIEEGAPTDTDVVTDEGGDSAETSVEEEDPLE